MINEKLTITESGLYYQEELLEQTYESAMQLHSEILASGQAAAYSLVQMCTKLKMMRDQKLYVQLGHETFDDYCEERAGIKARQAYTYIQLLERLPKDFLQSNASLGVTKLSLLAQLPPHELEGFTEVNDVNEISTRRLEELIAENKRLTEQLSLFQNAQESECPSDEPPEDSERVKELEAQLEKLQVMKKEADRKFKEYKTNEESRISAQVEAQVAEKASAAAAEKIAEEKTKIESTVKQEYEFRIASLTKEMNTASERAAELEKKLKLVDSTTAQFQIYFTAVQEDFNSMFTLIQSSADEDVKKKLVNAIGGLLYAMQQRVADKNE